MTLKLMRIFSIPHVNSFNVHEVGFYKRLQNFAEIIHATIVAYLDEIDPKKKVVDHPFDNPVSLIINDRNDGNVVTTSTLVQVSTPLLAEVEYSS